MGTTCPEQKGDFAQWHMGGGHHCCGLMLLIISFIRRSDAVFRERYIYPRTLKAASVPPVDARPAACSAVAVQG
jgi:hypothetical protein